MSIPEFFYYTSSVFGAVSLFVGIVIARCGLRATERTEDAQEVFVILAAVALVVGLIAGLIEVLV